MVEVSPNTIQSTSKEIAPGMVVHHLVSGHLTEGQVRALMQIRQTAYSQYNDDVPGVNASYFYDMLSPEPNHKVLGSVRGGVPESRSNLLVEVDGKPAGYLLTSTIRDGVDNRILVHDLATSPSYRQKIALLKEVLTSLGEDRSINAIEFRGLPPIAAMFEKPRIVAELDKEGFKVKRYESQGKNGFFGRFTKPDLPYFRVQRKMAAPKFIHR
jgi:hypothetical protein